MHASVPFAPNWMHGAGSQQMHVRVKMAGRAFDEFAKKADSSPIIITIDRQFMMYDAWQKQKLKMVFLNSCRLAPF